MAKPRIKIDAKSAQMSLFEILVEHSNRGQNGFSPAAAKNNSVPCSSMQETTKEQAVVVEGAGNVRERLRLALSAAIKQCSLSRWEIAGKMSHLLGHEISKYSLDAWTAESKEGHRLPAEYLPAFCSVTGDNGPLQLLAETAGLFALPGPDALRSEIRKLEEDSRRINQERRKRELFLKEMEK